MNGAAVEKEMLLFSFEAYLWFLRFLPADPTILFCSVMDTGIEIEKGARAIVQWLLALHMAYPTFP